MFAFLMGICPFVAMHVLTGAYYGPSAFDYAVEYIHDRKQFNVPVGTFQLMQGKCLESARFPMKPVINAQDLQARSPICTLK